MSNPDAEIRGRLKEIAHTLRRLGEEQQQWERDEIRWKKDNPPFDDFYFYVALATVWQSFSRRLEGERRRAFVKEIYETFCQVLEGRRSSGDLEAVYRISWNFSITRHPC